MSDPPWHSDPKTIIRLTGTAITIIVVGAWTLFSYLDQKFDQKYENLNARIDTLIDKIE